MPATIAPAPTNGAPRHVVTTKAPGHVLLNNIEESAFALWRIVEGAGSAAPEHETIWTARAIRMIGSGHARELGHLRKVSYGTRLDDYAAAAWAITSAITVLAVVIEKFEEVAGDIECGHPCTEEPDLRRAMQELASFYEENFASHETIARMRKSYEGDA